MNDDIAVRLAALEHRVSLLETRADVLRSERNRRVLKVLHDFAVSPFNDGSFTMTPDSISNATGLDGRDLGLALNELRRARFIECMKVDSTGHWRITDDGRFASLE